MSEIYELRAEVRERVGKGAARAVRRQDRIPAVIYGDKKPPIPISLPQREMTQRLHAGGFLTHIAMIDVDGCAEETKRFVARRRGQPNFSDGNN